MTDLIVCTFAVLAAILVATVADTYRQAKRRAALDRREMRESIKRGERGAR